MSFSLSSRNIVLDGTILRAECGDAKGGWPSSEFHLDKVLGNDNGSFRWLWTDFHASALETRLEGSILHAKLWPIDGEPCEASVDLDEHIANYYGELTLVHDDGTYSRLGQTQTSDGAFTTDNYFQTAFDFDEEEKGAKDRVYAADAAVRRNIAAAYFKDAPVYTYEPLMSKRSIRLVRIQSVHPVFVLCELKEVDLDAAPAFSALSYTWGNPFSSSSEELDQQFREMMTISCNGKRMQITQNLYEALRRLCQQSVLEEREELYNKTPLIDKAEDGAYTEVERLLREGADVDAVDEFDCTALHYAAENGHDLIVKALVYAGSNIHAIDCHGHTPLDCAKLSQSYSGPWIEIQRFLKHEARRKTRRMRKDSCLRNHVSDHQYVWIDAICINQEDNDEKASQVAMMGEIYRKATNAVVWLGPTYDKWDDPALSLLQGIWTLEGARQDGKIGDEVLERMLTLFDKPNPYEVEAKKADPASFAVRDWINTFDGNSLFDGWLLGPSFFHRTWFARVWILQEVFMSKDISMVCGQYIVPWDILIFMSSFIEGMRSSFRHKRSEQKIIIGAQIICGKTARAPALQLEHLKRLVREGGKLPMLYALQLTRNAQATDSRDKIFSALSFSNMWKSTKGGRRDVVPDYTTSVEALYTDIGKALMENYGPCALSLAGGTHQVEAGATGLPSWVPDLRVPSKVDVEANASLDFRSDSAHFDDSGTFHTRHLRITPSNILELAGLVLDSIAETTIPGLGNVGDDIENLASWVDFVDNSSEDGNSVLLEALIELPTHTSDLGDVDFRNWLVFLCLTSVFSLREDLQDAIEHSYVPEVEEPMIEAVESKPEEIAARFTKVKSLFARLNISFEDSDNDTFPTPIRNLFDSKPFSPSEPGKEGVQEVQLAKDELSSFWENIAPLAEPFGDALRKRNPDRRLMRTHSSGTIGAVPQAALVGDAICLVYGATVPYLLRKRNDGYYVFVGEAYVHGMRPQDTLLDAMMEGRTEKLVIV